MDISTLLSRGQFAFTIGFHYLFPQLTMGLALLIVILKTIYLRSHNELYNRAARFWARIFAITFIMGVVTGIPMDSRAIYAYHEWCSHHWLLLHGRTRRVLLASETAYRLWPLVCHYGDDRGPHSQPQPALSQWRPGRETGYDLSTSEASGDGRSLPHR